MSSVFLLLCTLLLMWSMYFWHHYCMMLYLIKCILIFTIHGAVTGLTTTAADSPSTALIEVQLTSQQWITNTVHTDIWKWLVWLIASIPVVATNRTVSNCLSVESLSSVNQPDHWSEWVSEWVLQGSGRGLHSSSLHSLVSVCCEPCTC